MKVYQRFLSHATAIADNAQQSVAGQKRTASVEQTSGIFSSLIGETSVTQRWVVSSHFTFIIVSTDKDLQAGLFLQRTLFACLSPNRFTKFNKKSTVLSSVVKFPTSNI